eukprot:2632901-Rhodomonas_salina.2
MGAVDAHAVGTGGQAVNLGRRQACFPGGTDVVGGGERRGGMEGKSREIEMPDSGAAAAMCSIAGPDLKLLRVLEQKGCVDGSGQGWIAECVRSTGSGFCEPERGGRVQRFLRLRWLRLPRKHLSVTRADRAGPGGGARTDGPGAETRGPVTSGPRV